MRKAILAAASGLAFGSPAIAADLPVTPYVEAPAYQREVHTYQYRTAPPVVVRPAPVVTETVVVRRPVLVAPPPVVVEPYPVYAVPRRVYAAPRVYAYGGPVWRGGWGHGHRGHFRGRW